MSVLLDTKVVSELIRKAPDPAVEEWAAGHALEDLFFSVVGEAELCYGTVILPAGRRRESLVSEIESMLRDAFEDRILPFDREAARAYAEIAAARRSAGRAVAPADCQIAAIARSRNMVATTPQPWINLQKTWELRQAEITAGREIDEQVTPRQSAAQGEVADARP